MEKLPKGELASSGELSSDKLNREADVLWRGLKIGLEKGVADAAADPFTVPQIVTAAALGAGLAAIQARAGGFALAGQVVAGAFTFSFLKDLAQKAGTVGTILSDTWDSADRRDDNVQLLAQATGPFATDMAMTALAGGVGSWAARSGAKAPVTGEGRARSGAHFSHRDTASTRLDGEIWAGIPRPAAHTPLLALDSSWPVGHRELERTAWTGTTGSGRPEKYYLRGRLNKEGVWEPVRDMSQLNRSGRLQILSIFRNAKIPLFRRQAVDDFVTTVGGAMKEFTPLDQDAPQELLNSRARVLEKAVNDYARRRHMPDFKLIAAQPASESSLVSGAMLFDREQGYIAIRNRDLYANATMGSAPTEVLVARLHHEVNHGQQVYSLFADAVQEAGSNTVAELSEYQRIDLEDGLRRRLGGVKITDEYFHRIASAYEREVDPTSLSSPTRNIKLFGGFVRGREPGPEFAEAKQAATAAAGLLRNATDSGGVSTVLKQLQSKQARTSIFGSYINTDLEHLIEKGDASEPGAAELLRSSLQNRIDELNQTRKTIYARYIQFPELESMLVESRTLRRARAILGNGSISQVTPNSVH